MSVRALEAVRSIDVEVTRITPKEAAALLETNSVNRKLRTPLVEAYRRDMEEGRWAMTGETIQISRTGQLLNGQHRLTALAGSKKLRRGIDFLVVTGLDDNTQGLMDQGAKRGIADALRISQGHVKNVTIVGGIARWSIAYPELGVGSMLQQLKRKISVAEAVEAYMNQPDIADAADRAVFFRGHIPVSVTAMGFTWLHLNRIDSSANHEFWGSMVDLSFGAKDDPRKATLKRLTSMAADPEFRANMQTSVAVVSVLTRGWNAWRRGEQLPFITAKNKGGIIEPVTPI